MLIKSFLHRRRYKKLVRRGCLLLSLTAFSGTTFCAEPPEPQTMAKRLHNVIKVVRSPTNRAVRTTPRQNALPSLRKRAGDSLDIQMRSSVGTPIQIKANILERATTRNFRSKKARDEETARQFLRRNRALIGLKNPDQELELVRQWIDELGRSHLRFSQRYHGLPVWPAELTVHLNPDGDVHLMNGTFVRTPPKPLLLTPFVTAAEAINLALAKKIPNSHNGMASLPQLIVYAPGKTSPRLAWKFDVDVSMNTSWVTVIDAITGELLTQYNQMMGAAAATGSGQDGLGEKRALNLWEENGTYTMVDTSKPMFDSSVPLSISANHIEAKGAIIVYDNQNVSDSGSRGVFAESVSVTSTDPNAGFVADAVGAAYLLSQVYDYYLERQARNSIDGQGGNLVGIVRVGQNLKNAYWNDTFQAMVFGDGRPFANALDVVAHEMTHGITSKTANLIYLDQPGALNEAFSDIFGEMVEAYATGQSDWLVGTNLGKITRNMKDPSSLRIKDTPWAPHYPNKMSEYLTKKDIDPLGVGNNDNGGVHLNSSIINHAYYLLAEGLEGAIGLKEAEKIFYRTLTMHLTQNSQFIDARFAAINSAEELFGVGSTQAIKTAEAFDAVEIINIPRTPPPHIAFFCGRYGAGFHLVWLCESRFWCNGVMSS